MRSSLAWLALLPLLAACAAEPGTADDETAGSRPVPANGDAPGDTSDDPGAPGSAPGSTAPGGAPGTACVAQPSCDGASSPTLAPMRSFNHYASSAIALTGPAFHRGRDQIVSAGEPQWILGKFTYSYIDTDLDDEDVDIFVERSCAGAWEKLGSTKTTTAGAHATVEDVKDTGGRVYFEIPKANELAPGRHRIRMVVAADHTFADLIIDVVPKGTRIVVSDVDGTLTDSETAEYPAMLKGLVPGAQPRAADALSSLAAKGYHVVYLTARPEWLTGRTTEFLKQKGFPPGVVHTTTGITGLPGAAAATFKTAELALLKAHGHTIEWAFGNTTGDTDAYNAAEINPVDHRVFLRADDAHGGRRIEAYSEILPALAASPAACK